MAIRQISYVNIILMTVLWLSACSIVPATTPPQLEHTPGTPITITATQIDAGWFTLDYPDGWRVVTNVAQDPLLLTIVSPDDRLIIYVQQTLTPCNVPSATPDPQYYQRDECLGDNRNLYIWGRPEIEFESEYQAIFDDVIRSVTFQ